ncbi:hypothetical protein J3458_004307 [Metarhizium acridum]|uniref:uncharacterized protein n=1 Tax=Metarhizium acridum TaxID=92637 RepID=UPI001C6C8B9F|nr:hypothetical protein J3458_004307 [Metarhizium acridum]
MAKTLWDYVRDACGQCNISIPSDKLPFNNNQDVKSSVIDPEGRNRVLLFPGAFNPAHEGHLQLLRSVLNDMKNHLNIRGVVIFPNDDEKIREKTMEEPVDLDLNKSKRSALWRNAAGFPANNAWIFAESRSALTRFQEQLHGNLTKENINLTFLLLVGSDWISTRAVYDPGQWSCSETITSDVSRPVDFRCEYTLRQIPGCFDWVQRFFAESAPCIPWDPFQISYGSRIMEGVSLWSTSTVTTPVRRYYLVPCLRACSPGTPYPSSTSIRQRIFEACSERLPVDEAVLATALSPDTLLGYIRENMPFLDEEEVKGEES